MQFLGNEHLKVHLKWLVTVVILYIYNLRKLPCDWQIYKACVRVCPTSVLAAAGFLVALTLVLRLCPLSPTSSSECSVLVSDRSELCWDDVSSIRDAAATERAAGQDRDWWTVSQSSWVFRVTSPHDLRDTKHHTSAFYCCHRTA